MNLLITYGAVLLLGLLALALPALAHTQHWTVMRADWRDPRRLIFGFWREEWGTAVITYCWPGGPTGRTITAPTPSAAAGVTEMTVIVSMADADTSAVVVHNWGLPASFPSFLFPLVTYTQDTIGVGPSTDLATLTFDLTNTNQVTITKVNALGSGGSFRVFLSRPHSLIR